MKKQNCEDPHEKRINRQKKLSEPYSESHPTKTSKIHWIYAERKVGCYPNSTRRSGKWLIFVSKSEVDQLWSKVKSLTENGKLGNYSKVSTMRLLKISRNPNRKVICVYTYDWTDKKDVMKIREELRKIGITQKIPYKTNEDTLNGRYVWKGDENIYKYLL